MDQFYTYCALIGGGLMILQFLLGLLGLGHHSDAHEIPVGDGDFDAPADGLDHEAPADGFDHAGHWFVGLFSFRSVVAALTVFGLAGLAAGRYFPDPLKPLVIAGFAGGGMLYAVAWMLRWAYRLRSEGNLRVERALGQLGSVYLSVPGRNSGTGKVTLKLQGRTVELRAMTPEETLPSGTPITVIGVRSPGVVEVAPASRTALVEGEVQV